MSGLSHGQKNILAIAHLAPALLDGLAGSTPVKRPIQNSALIVSRSVTIRLFEMNLLLSSRGCLYLQCDSTISHYIKIIMDGVFGHQNFRNEIIWKRRYGTFSTVHESTKFGASTDTILFYVKGKDAVFQ